MLGAAPAEEAIWHHQHKKTCLSNYSGFLFPFLNV
jgi:hypothetical protein